MLTRGNQAALGLNAGAPAFVLCPHGADHLTLELQTARL